MQGGYERFQELIGSVMASEIIENRPEEIESVIRSMALLDGDGDALEETSSNDRFLFNVVRGFSEIVECHEVVQDIDVYIRRFPYTGTRITRGRYLAHQVGVYLNELYILKERLEAFAKRIIRAYRNTTRRDKVKGMVEPLLNDVDTVLRAQVVARGAHVHERRYTDPDVNQLLALECLGFHPEVGDSLRGAQEHIYKEVRKRWVKAMRQSAENLGEFLDSYFGAVYEAVTEDDRLVFPSACKFSAS